jgi:acyl carrier protein
LTGITGAPVQREPQQEDLRAAVLEALAQVRAASVGELQEEMTASGGDLEIDSREAEAVIAILEHRYGQELAKVEDLEPECLPSIGSLTELIHRRWPAGQPVAGSAVE